jgi:hypothetical protein
MTTLEKAQSLDHWPPQALSEAQLHQSPKTARVSVSLLRELLEALFDAEADVARLACDLRYLIDVAEGVTA